MRKWIVMSLVVGSSIFSVISASANTPAAIILGALLENKNSELFSHIVYFLNKNNFKFKALSPSSRQVFISYLVEHLFQNRTSFSSQEIENKVVEAYLIAGLS